MIRGLQIRRNPTVLVENKVSFMAENSELSIYDTYEVAERVKLSSDQLMFCGMVTGKKIMHVEQQGFHNDFLPHESFVMAPNQEVEIDFPEAQLNTPTTCIAIEIAPERVQTVANRLNALSPVEDEYGDWAYQHSLLHTHHTSETQSLLNRIVQIYTENHPDRSFLIDLAVTELSARLLRHQTRNFIVAYSEADPELNALNAVVNHILANISEPLDIDVLAKLACMSRTKFFSYFKRHLGCTPIVFQQQERLKLAAKMLQSGKQITETCFSVGFKNPSHFTKVFKQFYGFSPKEYQYRSRVN
jgi:AraC-like DNA-binding protein